MNNIAFMTKIAWNEFLPKERKVSDKESIGFFVTFGVDYEELQSGAGTYSTIIVLDEKNKFHNIPVANCRLI